MKTRFAPLRRLRTAGLAAGAVAVAGLALLVAASASGLTIGFRPAGAAQPASIDATVAALSKPNGTSAACTDFISHLSTDLGKSQSQVQAAVQKALGETLADLVKSGKLTQAQADAISKRFKNQDVCALRGALGPPALPKANAYLKPLEAAAASALGISAADLQADLAKGMTLSQIAAAQNPPVSEDTFRTRLIAQLKPLLDKAVTDKKLTQAQEDTILQRLKSGPIPFWTRPVRKPVTASPGPVQAA